MITVGLTPARHHVALIRDDRLELSAGCPRDDEAYGGDGAMPLPRLLAAHGYQMADVDAWVTSGAAVAGIRADASYPRLVSQAAAAYGTSPFARDGQPSMVLVWDDGDFPRLFHAGAGGQIEAGGELFPLTGPSYATIVRMVLGGRAGPDRKPSAVDDPWAGLPPGAADEDTVATFRDLFHEHFEADTPAAKAYRQAVGGGGDTTGGPPYRYLRAYLGGVEARLARSGGSDQELLASLHTFLGRLLAERLTERIRQWRGDGRYHLCFTGTGALDVTWSSALRDHPMVGAMWIPPFLDGSGAAIGAAVLHTGRRGGLRGLDWTVRAGPDLRRHPHLPPGWTASLCRPEEFARLLHQQGRPAVMLSGRAKAGPRALGARSVLAPAVDPASRAWLHRIGWRERSGPVAAVCLESDAPHLFDPGTPDPYLQYRHRVRPEWTDRIPAVVHHDGTARVQTVDRADDPALAAVLREYRTWSGVPALCHTAAGVTGQFPDAASAMRWGQVDAVWSDGVLHRRVHDRDSRTAGRRTG